MSKTRQISISLPEDLIETIQASVASGEARSVSAYITERLRPGSIIDSLFAEWDAESGPVPAAESRWAESELDRAFGEAQEGRKGTEAA